MSILYIMCGCPGSGKSSYIQDLFDHSDLSIFNKTITCISRDNIRFGLVKESESYFSKEKEVFKQFISEIDNALKNYDVVFADATHINRASRKKLLSHLAIKPQAIRVIWMNTSLEKCLEYNKKRAGTRSYVPESAIYDMYSRFEKPTLSEGFNTIYTVTTF